MILRGYGSGHAGGQREKESVIAQAGDGRAALIDWVGCEVEEWFY